MELTPSIIIPYDSLSRKTWIYHAENVHDFAFTADPSYRIGEADWNGIRAISLVQEPHASRWQNAADFAAKVIRFSLKISVCTFITKSLLLMLEMVWNIP